MNTPPILAATPVAGLALIPICDLFPNPDNPRARLRDLDDLAASITAQGIIQPVVVMPHPDKADCYQILAGHRRVAAAEIAGLDHVPCVVRKGRTVAASLELALVENGQRHDLDPIEEAHAIRALMTQAGMNQAQVAARMGRSSAHVSTRLALLELSPTQQGQVRDGSMPAYKAHNTIMRKRGSAGTKPWNHHFSAAHPLAIEARGICKATHGRKARLVGGQACGACWEAAIRADESGTTGDTGWVPA